MVIMKQNPLNNLQIKPMMSTHATTLFLRRLVFACCLGLGAVSTWAQTLPSAAASEKQDNGNLVSLNFNNVDIDAVVKAIGKISGKNFVVDPRVKGTLNIVTNTPVPRSLTYSILLSALRLQGYTAVEGNNVVTILPEADAKMHSVPVGKTRTPVATGDKIVTEVFQINHESASQLLQVVRPLVTPNNTVSVYPGNNSLVITDYAENISRIAKIIAAIDVPQGDSTVIPVLHASAVDLANMLNKLYGDAATNNGASTEPSMKVTVMADARSNSLLVRAENRSRMQAVRSMATQLDQAGATSNIRVIFLKNANAVKVAQTLRAVLTGDASSGSGGQSSNTSSSLSGNSSNSNYSSNSSSSSSTSSSSSNSGLSSTGGNFSQSSNSSNVVGGGNIFADVANNALVITGTDAIYNNVRAVIDELDRRQAQVYVEALIAEVTADRAAEYGIQWQSAIPTNGSTTVYGGTNFGTSSSGTNIIGIAKDITSASTGLNFIIGSGPVTVNGTEIFNLNFLARLLETDAKANILSTPSILTVDNEEAKIVVGKNVPFITGSYTSTTTSASNPFQTYERKDVGLTLKIKPQITEGGSIRMQIYQEVSAVIDSTANSSSGASTTKRSIESTVIVDNGSIIALGGLMQDSYSGSVSKVPVLGDLPFIGPLFRYDNRSRSKTNLMIFLRPRIFHTAQDSADFSSTRYEDIIGVQKSADKPSALLRNEDPLPSMPVQQKDNAGDKAAPAQ